MLSGKNEFDEDRIVQGYNGDGLMDYDAGVIQKLETTDAILTYNMLAPYSKEAAEYVHILYNIINGVDITDEQSNYLDSIDSRFIAHSTKKELTNREILCLFLNEYWEWSSLDLPKTRDVNVSFRGLFSAYSKFCKDNHFNQHTRQLKRAKFEDYLEHYGNIRRIQRNINGKKIDNKVILDMPSYREDLKEIPEFDLRVYSAKGGKKA